jgi:hypothetical protein
VPLQSKESLVLSEEELKALLGMDGENQAGQEAAPKYVLDGNGLSKELNSDNLISTIQELSATVTGLTSRIRVLEEQLARLRSGMDDRPDKSDDRTAKRLKDMGEEENPSQSLWESIRAHALADRPRSSYVWTTPIVKAGSRSASAGRPGEQHAAKPMSEPQSIPSLPSRSEKYRGRK